MSGQVEIKEHHELRHVLAHLYAAIDAVRTGHLRVAEQELESVGNLIFFEDPDNEAVEQFLKRREEHHGGKEEEPVQG